VKWGDSEKIAKKYFEIRFSIRNQKKVKTEFELLHVKGRGPFLGTHSRKIEFGFVPLLIHLSGGFYYLLIVNHKISQSMMCYFQMRKTTSIQ
jgi:hypothetical protein